MNVNERFTNKYNKHLKQIAQKRESNVPIRIDSFSKKYKQKDGDELLKQVKMDGQQR